MRKRRSSRGDVLIDLTSLLDVMFIILLVTLWGRHATEDTLKETQVATENAKAQLEAEYQLYEQQLELADSLNQFVWAVSVVVPYDAEDVTKRQLKMLQEGEEIESFDMEGNNVEDAVKAFRKSLVSYIRDNEERPVILSLNEEDGNILYRDEVMVNEIFRELADEYANVYIKGSVGGKK